jgi:AraC-like DNA-binding protein
MVFSFEAFINIIFFVGAIQGIILTLFLFNAKSNKLSNRLLGILTFLWAIILLVFALQSYGLYRTYPDLLKVFFPILFTWFPLLFLSVKYLITSHKKFDKKDFLHFIPLIICIFLNIDFYFKTGTEKIELINNPTVYYQVIDMISEEIIAMQGVVYSILTLIILNTYMSRVVDFHANVDRTILKGLKAGIILSLIAWVIGIVGMIIERAKIDLGVDLFLFVYLFFVAIIYIISIISIRSGEVFKLRGDQVTDLFTPERKIKSHQRIINQKITFTDKNINELGLKEEVFETELNNRLLEYMENAKPYLNPDFSLQALSDDLNVSRHQLSSTINARQKMNFYEFVNSYRIQEVKELMNDPANRNQNNYELAFEAGFNSKATFYRIFKQLTHQTPSAYRSSLHKPEQ